MKFQFTLSQTSAARKRYRIVAGREKEMSDVARCVVETEMPKLTEFTLSLVTMSDAELLAMNQSALGHDWFTDIITFEIERTETALEAEIYLSVDRALANARRYRQAKDVEMLHLVIHGLLHLAGYDDKSTKGKKQMRARERWYLVRIRP
ncbi:MAG TPA: rRNA maturation RNase YbeY [Candidatus Kapabacteria bacterium]|nr:rRNA maturation RNase YbeY [Candidatus Kapabacteria bacterium]